MVRHLRLSLLIAASMLLSAHPMGNFSINHYARFDAEGAEIRLTYVLDFAEIPTFELLQGWSIDGRDSKELSVRAEGEASSWLSGLRIQSDGVEVKPHLTRVTAQVTEGAGGLPVLRVVLHAAMRGSSGRFAYEDTNYPNRAGWKEIVVSAKNGATLRSTSLSASDRSRELTIYPEDGTAPPQNLQASFEVVVPAVPVRKDPPMKTPAPPAAPAPQVSFSAKQQPKSTANLVQGDYLSTMLGGRNITLGMILIGICAAFGLGAFHALSPGHGKTIVAAYLVGSRCNVKHAAILGLTVTFTHTISVFLLGLGVLFFEQYIQADKAITWLGAVSGLSIVALGGSLLYSRARALRDSDGKRVGHFHGTVFHSHDGDESQQHVHVPDGPISLAGLIALGVSGGLVPCPSALVLLLSSVAFGRVGLGMILLVGFSAGLALVLMAVGALVLFTKNRLPVQARVNWSALRYAPLVSACIVILLGFVMTGVSLGWIRPIPLT